MFVSYKYASIYFHFISESIYYCFEKLSFLNN